MEIVDILNAMKQLIIFPGFYGPGRSITAGVHKCRVRGCPSNILYVVLNICEYSVWHLLHATLQASSIVTCSVDFWKISAHLHYRIQPIPNYINPVTGTILRSILILPS